MPRSRRTAALALVLSVPLALPATLLSAAPASAAGASAGGKTSICHRTHSVKNPYRLISVSNSAINGSSTRDHTHHTGPLFDAAYDYPPNAKIWGDIIPPVGSSTGSNWSPAGQARYNGTPRCATGSAMTAAAFYNVEREAGVPAAEILADLKDQAADGDPAPTEIDRITYTGSDPSVPESPTNPANATPAPTTPAPTTPAPTTPAPTTPAPTTPAPTTPAPTTPAPTTPAPTTPAPTTPASVEPEPTATTSGPGEPSPSSTTTAPAEPAPTTTTTATA